MFFRMMYLCAACDTIFCTPKWEVILGEDTEICPNPFCGVTEHDWDPIQDEHLWGQFTRIIGANFDEVRRMNLRLIAEETMEPYNPLQRDL